MLRISTCKTSITLVFFWPFLFFQKDGGRQASNSVSPSVCYATSIMLSGTL